MEFLQRRNGQNLDITKLNRGKTEHHEKNEQKVAQSSLKLLYKELILAFKIQ